MPTYTVNREELESGLCTISGKEAHHLGRVLRVQEGERIDLTDGQGKLFEGKIKSVGKEITVSVIRELNSPAPFPVHLFVSFLKKEKMEFIVEKAVELNIASVTFVKTHHSVRTDISEIKRERMDRIVQAAFKQCGRTHPLVIETMNHMEAPKQMTHFICVEREGAKAFKDFKLPAPPYGIWIGPEGGWDADEKEQMKKAGFQPVTLGHLVMKAETAAIHAVSSLLTLI